MIDRRTLLKTAALGLLAKQTKAQMPLPPGESTSGGGAGGAALSFQPNTLLQSMYGATVTQQPTIDYGTGGVASATSYTANFTTVAATDACLFVAVVGDTRSRADDLVSVTFGGQPLTLATDGVHVAKSNGGSHWTYMLMLDNPPIGTYPIVATFASAHRIRAGAFQYNGKLPGNVDVVKIDTYSGNPINTFASNITPTHPFSWAICLENVNTGVDAGAEVGANNQDLRRGADVVPTGYGGFYSSWSWFDTQFAITPIAAHTFTTHRPTSYSGCAHIKIAIRPSLGSATQALAGATLTNNTFTGGDPGGQIVGEILTTLTNPGLNPKFQGTYAATDSHFRVDNTVYPPRLLLKGTQPVGSYSTSLVATGTTGVYSNSPQTFGPFTITGAAFDSNMTCVLSGLPTVEGGLGGDAPGTLSFSMADATDAGTYVGAFVTQRCFIQYKGFFNVHFRPDALTQGARTEVVVERGCYPVPAGLGGATHLWNPNSYPGIISGTQPHTTTIKQGASIKAIQLVNWHWWGARWRWQSAMRAIVRTPTQVFTTKFTLPLTVGASYGIQRITKLQHDGTRGGPVASYDYPMSCGGLSPVMGAGGSRPELGYLGEYFADWALYNDSYTPYAIQGMRAQAEGMGTMPVWFRDRNTNAYLNTYGPNGPGQNLGYASVALPGGGDGGLPGVNAANSRFHTYPGPPDLGAVPWIQMEQDHMYNTAWAAWAATDDPYFYECSEIAAHHSYYCTNIHRGVYNTYPTPKENQGQWSTAQSRGFAFALRDVSRHAMFAPISPPSWLMPRSYWTRVLSDNLMLAQLWPTSTAKVSTIFRQLIASSGGAFYMMANYLTLPLAWMVWTGFFSSAWTDIAKWFAPAVLSMVDGLSGWDRRWPCMYLQIWAGIKPSAHHPNGLYTPSQSGFVASGAMPNPDAAPDTWDDITPNSWAEAWSLFPAWQLKNGQQSPYNMTIPNRIYWNAIDPTAPGSLPVSNPEYLLDIRAGVAALSLALRHTPIQAPYGTTYADDAANWLEDTLGTTGRKIFQEALSSFNGTFTKSYDLTGFSIYYLSSAVPKSYP